MSERFSEPATSNSVGTVSLARGAHPSQRGRRVYDHLLISGRQHLGKSRGRRASNSIKGNNRRGGNGRILVGKQFYEARHGPRPMFASAAIAVPRCGALIGDSMGMRSSMMPGPACPSDPAAVSDSCCN